MSIVIERPAAEKVKGRRRSPPRYTPTIKFQEPPSKPLRPAVQRTTGGGVIVTTPISAFDVARQAFFQSLPKFESEVVSGDEKLRRLEALAAVRREFRYGVSIDIADTLTRLHDIRKSLVRAFADSTAHTLWRLDGLVRFQQLPPKFPNLDRKQLWAAGMFGLGSALDRGVVRNFQKLLRHCIEASCIDANRRAPEPRKIPVRGFGKPTRRMSPAVAAAYKTYMAGGFPLLND